jgi:hypothetical protein
VTVHAPPRHEFTHWAPVSHVKVQPPPAQVLLQCAPDSQRISQWPPAHAKTELVCGSATNAHPPVWQLVPQTNVESALHVHDPSVACAHGVSGLGDALDPLDPAVDPLEPPGGVPLGPPPDGPASPPVLITVVLEQPITMQSKAYDATLRSVMKPPAHAPRKDRSDAPAHGSRSPRRSIMR